MKVEAKMSNFEFEKTKQTVLYTSGRQSILSLTLSQNLLTPFTTMPIFSIINPFGFITLFISIVPYGLPSSCRRFSRPPRILPSLLLFRSIFHDRRRLHFQNSRNPGPRTSSSFCPSCRRSRCSATPPSFSLFQLRVSNCI